MTNTNQYLNNDFSVGNTVMKLALVGGILLSCMYGILVACASVFKVLG